MCYKLSYDLKPHAQTKSFMNIVYDFWQRNKMF